MPLRYAAERLIEGDAIRPRPRAALRELLEGLRRWNAALEKEGHVVVAAQVLEESGYVEMWKADRSLEAPGRLDNLKELVRAMAEFATLGAFLEHIALVMDVDDAAEGEKVSLMTLHAAKGLEFDMVFLPGWEEGLFPSQRSLDEGGAKSLEEERRLAYVGITRAKRLCTISHAANRRIYGNWTSSIPSRFLDELPEAEIERQGAVRQKPTLPSSVFSAGALSSVRRPRVIEAGAWEVDQRPEREKAFAVGTRVFHQKFGYGRVTGVDDDRLDVEFERAGAKRVLDRFVEPA
jgi:DNA helicase-2/ATP-dependent DNA helicase PcrA